jgi:hypothetical protein
LVSGGREGGGVGEEEGVHLYIYIWARIRWHGLPSVWSEFAPEVWPFRRRSGFG